MKKDVFLNILTSMLAVVVTQVVAYPFIASQMTSENYGVFLTVMGLINLIAVSIGNPLNNTRLLMSSNYETGCKQGDFNNILIKLLGISLSLSIVLFICIGYQYKEIVLLCLLICLITIRSYYSVYFRIKINYVKNFISTLIGSFGVLLGILLFKITGMWVFIFLISEIFACVYILYKNPLIKESIIKTNKYKQIKSKFLFLFGGAFVSSLVTYMDRFFILPILGARYVSYYNVSSFLGKTAGIILLPISGVLLTYYAKESGISKSAFYKRFHVFLLFSGFLYGLLLIIGPGILKILYPTIYAQAFKYYKLSTLGSILFILSNTLQPTLLRYAEDKWQTIIQSLYLIIYILLSVVFMNFFGLMGFCIAVVLSNLFKIMIMFVVINKSIGG